MSNQEQLVQIMESVKKGDFNTDDALMLFKDWKEKNMGEESNSFKKKKVNDFHRFCVCGISEAM